MSGIKPTFTTGSRVRIKLNGKTVAHAQGLSMGFSVMVEPVRVMGEYGAISAVVSGYSGVQGSLQIISLMPKQARDALQSLVNADKVNIGELSAAGVVTPDLTLQNGDGSRGQVLSADYITNPLDEAKYHLDPERVLLSQSFDIQIYMRYADSTGKYKEFLQWEIKDCRLSGRSVSINSGSPVGQDFQYKGLLLTHAARPDGLREQMDLPRDTNSI
jgi:hypothetical protein